jgi:hypothetical protein
MLYDVVAVNMATHKVRLLAENKTESNADAVVSMAVARRGCDEEFFAAAAAGKYRDGDEWRADEEG